MKSYWQSTVLFLGSLLLGAMLMWFWVGHVALACEVEKMEASYNQRIIDAKDQHIRALESHNAALLSRLTKAETKPVMAMAVERVEPEPVTMAQPVSVSPTEHASLIQIGKAAASETLQQAKALIQSGWRLMAGAPRFP